MKATLVRWFGVLALAVGLAASAIANAAPTFPALTGRVVDQAGMLPPETETALTAKLASLEAGTARQLVVVTVTSLQDYEIEDFGYQLGRTWGIGEARKNTGVLLIVAPNERRVRIEVGYGLEPVLTDALSNQILQNIVLPRFRNGNMADGVVAGADAIIEQLSLPPNEAQARASDAASGEAVDDPLSLVFIAFVMFWIVFGLVGVMRGRGVSGWLWPLLFLMHHGGRGGNNSFHGRGGSFGGGGASGRW
jgi:uncharacterized protein